MSDQIFENSRLVSIYDAFDGHRITSDSTLRFHQREEIAESLKKMGYAVKEVRSAPDRPGKEFVFIAEAI